MARFLPGIAIADIRGSVGGATFSRARSGNTIRSRTTCINPQTVKQANVKNNLSTVSRQFRDMGSIGVAAWNSAANAWPVTDKFGRTRWPSGSELFNQLNTNLVSVGLSMNTSPPTQATAATPIAYNFLADSGAQTMSFDTNMPAGGGFVLKVFATPPLSAGISSINNLFKLILYNSNPGITTYQVQPDYSYTFPNFYRTNQVIYIKLIWINVSNGQAFPPQILRAIVS